MHRLPNLQKLFNNDQHPTHLPIMRQSSSGGSERPENEAIVLHPSASTAIHAGPDSYQQQTKSLQRESSASRTLSHLPSIDELIGISGIYDSERLLQSSKTMKRDPCSADKGTKIASSSSSKKEAGYPCERCGRVFRRKADRLKHIRVVHDKIKTFSCVVCGKKFGRKDYCIVSTSLLSNMLYEKFCCFVHLTEVIFPYCAFIFCNLCCLLET